MSLLWHPMQAVAVVGSWPWKCFGGSGGKIKLNCVMLVAERSVCDSEPSILDPLEHSEMLLPSLGGEVGQREWDLSVKASSFL